MSHSVLFVILMFELSAGAASFWKFKAPINGENCRSEILTGVSCKIKRAPTPGTWQTYEEIPVQPSDIYSCGGNPQKEVFKLVRNVYFENPIVELTLVRNKDGAIHLNFAQCGSSNREGCPRVADLLIPSLRQLTVALKSTN